MVVSFNFINEFNDFSSPMKRKLLQNAHIKISELLVIFLDRNLNRIAICVFVTIEFNIIAPM